MTAPAQMHAVSGAPSATVAISCSAGADARQHAMAQSYDQVATSYDAYYAQMPSARWEDRWLQRLLRSLWQPEDFVLDLGCGTGALLTLLPVPPVQYLGVDLSPGMLDQAVTQYPSHTFLQADIQTLTLCPRSLAPRQPTLAVSLFGPYSYVEDVPAAWARLRTMLAPQARFCFVLYGPGHLRPAHHYVCGPTGLAWCSTAAAVRQWIVHDLRPAWWRLRGLTWLLDYCPPWCPPGLLGWVDQWTVGRFQPDRCSFLVCWGGW
jgi:SAM-dependent methyltransferase